MKLEVTKIANSNKNKENNKLKRQQLQGCLEKSLRDEETIVGNIPLKMHAQQVDKLRGLLLPLLLPENLRGNMRATLLGFLPNVILYQLQI